MSKTVILCPCSSESKFHPALSNSATTSSTMFSGEDSSELSAVVGSSLLGNIFEIILLIYLPARSSVSVLLGILGDCAVATTEVVLVSPKLLLIKL